MNDNHARGVERAKEIFAELQEEMADNYETVCPGCLSIELAERLMTLSAANMIITIARRESGASDEDPVSIGPDALLIALPEIMDGFEMLAKSCLQEAAMNLVTGKSVTVAEMRETKAEAKEKLDQLLRKGGD